MNLVQQKKLVQQHFILFYFFFLVTSILYAYIFSILLKRDIALDFDALLLRQSSVPINFLNPAVSNGRSFEVHHKPSLNIYKRPLLLQYSNTH